jgi:hypothetical protein
MSYDTRRPADARLAHISMRIVHLAVQFATL